MGIPNYFSLIVRNHRSILEKFKKERIDNLYLDCNSIIYDSLRNNSLYSKHSTQKFEEALLNEVCSKIQEYIFQLNPKNTVFIAFDGVAPVAKLSQQRNRRYKSWFQKEITTQIKKQTTSSTTWDATAITPGTNFMDKLCEKIKRYFTKAEKFNVKDIIVSTSDTVGEGEHKIYEYIRTNPNKHRSEITVIYGLDADLIMLTLNHLRICPKMFLFRETPEFIKSIDRGLDPNVLYMLNIPELAIAITKEMNMIKHTKLNQELDTNRLYDYIFMCFFLGNDFIPHFPALNIRTNGMEYLLDAYKETIGDTQNYLTDGNKINWNSLRKFIGYLAKNEKKYILHEYTIRDKWEKRRVNYNFRSDEEREKAKEDYFMSLPTKERDLEKYINPHSQYWEHRYYKTLLDVDIDKIRKKQICTNFLEAIEWNMKYYTTGCCDWRWCYNYDYPPLLVDLIQFIPYFDTEFITKKEQTPIDPMVQLAYVLPRNSLHLIPEEKKQKLLEEMSDKYRLDYDFKWAFCKYFWESHVDLPEIKIERLEELLRT
jgi:5'-3' exoribonuclease 1